MSGVQSREPMQMPLTGLRLVEASAGTGKTFALAGLYLRLLIEQKLDVRDILVMTFTRAATQELRGRIRARLHRAAALAADPGSADPHSGEDKLILDLMDKAGAPAHELARQLNSAAARMDEATITTIHGFSQAAVAENAFDSGVAFDRGEQTDDAPLFEEATGDWWRCQVIGGDNPDVARLWPTPGVCFSELGEVLNKPHLQLTGLDDKALRKLSGQAQKAWEAQYESLAETLAGVLEAGEFNSKSTLKPLIEAAGGVEALMAECDAAVNARPWPLPHPALYFLQTDQLVAEFKGKAKKQGVDEAVTRAGDLAYRATQQARLKRIREAVTGIHQAVAELKQSRRLFSFEDMIAALHEAVTEGPRRDKLCQALRQRWPWALVDEFQDTDRRQYGILHAIYGEVSQGGLIMIGDPKQAIYGFRGGDVYAYLQAGGDAAAAPYGLETNYRSTGPLLQAIETLFRLPPERPFVIEAIDFVSVKAGRGENDCVIRVGDAPLAPLSLWELQAEDAGKLLSKGQARTQLINATVAEIARLLSPETGARVEKPGETRPLTPGDICVLVNSNAEAVQLQLALGRQGVPAVCAHQDSVFQTPQARQLRHVLRAVAVPADLRRVQTALCGELFGWRLGDLLAMQGDETRWQPCYELFQQAHQRWLAHGVLAMLEPLIQQAAPRLLSLVDGERRATNWLHLAELLQAAEQDTFGLAGLIRWLEEQCSQQPSGVESTEAAQLRLESDEALVRITTIHRAKGLQYPVVMLPFAPWLGTGGQRPDTPPFTFHDQRGQACLQLVDDGQNAGLGQAVLERKAEALRVLYVALTRAEQAVYLGWGPVTGACNGALAWLLHSGEGCPDTQWQTRQDEFGDWFGPETVKNRIDVLQQAVGEQMQRLPLVAEPGAVRLIESTPASLDQVREDLPAPREPWFMLSFTALVRGVAGGLAPRAGADDETPVETVTAAEGGAGSSALDPLLDRFTGAAFGSAVHDLLEHADPAIWPSPEKTPDDAIMRMVHGALRRWGVVLAGQSEAGHRSQLQAVAQLVGRTLHTPLPELGPLAAVAPAQQLAEMGFAMRLQGGAAGDVIDTLAAFGYASALPEEHRRRVLRGLMHGFIDLVVEHQGRYWVLDYKTNRLGEHAGDYAPKALQSAVHRGHYDLQYLIYLVALHRHLRQRLPDYQPEQHLGGVQYLFVRGMNGVNADTGVYLDRPPAALIAALDALFDAREVSA